MSKSKDNSATKIATFEFKEGETFKTADQIIDGMMHFGLIEYYDEHNLDLVIIKDFSIGWMEEA